MRQTHFYILAALMVLVSCGKSKLAPQDYVGWFNDQDNEMIKSYEQGSVSLSCQYFSPEYAVLMQKDPSTVAADDVIEDIAFTTDFTQFKLTFENTESNNFMRDNYTTGEEFNTRSMYLGFGMQEDLELVVGNDTVSCDMSHHERTYGNTPYENVMVSFPVANASNEDMTLIFNDRVFGLGRVKFNFQSSELDAIPELKL